MNRFFALAALAGLIVSGCASGDAGKTTPESASTSNSTTSTTEPAKPETNTDPAATSAASTTTPDPAATTTQPAANPDEKLKMVDVKVGTGKQVLAEGDRAFVIYTGKLTDGTMFDSNDAPTKEPLSFVVGAGGVIPGWEKGLLGMKKGGKRKLTVPPSMGYGDKANGPIPANSTLEFEIELLDMVKKGEDNVWEKTILKQGSGAGAKKGDSITVHYTGWLVNGRKFDSSKDSGRPYTLTLGAGQVIAGWDAGIVGMKKGETRRLWIAPGIAYGAAAREGIPSDSILIFEIEMLKINGK